MPSLLGLAEDDDADHRLLTLVRLALDSAITHCSRDAYIQGNWRWNPSDPDSTGNKSLKNGQDMGLELAQRSPRTMF